MFDAFFEGFLLVFQWPAIGYLFLGVVLGIWLGAVPGLGSITGLILLLPFTYSMDAVSAFALLLGMFAVTTTSDTISSVMLGIPGTAASQAVIIDGYPMAQKGQASRAFGASFTVSAIGGLFGAFVMAASLPIIKPVILSFNSPEIFMLGLLGLSLVGALAGDSLFKGLAVAALGLLISTIGYAQTVSVPRFYFDQTYLLDGLPLIPIVLGLFGLPELMELAVRNVSISRVPRDQSAGGGIWGGVRETFRNWWLALRCSAIGTYVGMIPGLGGSIVDWIAYAHTVQSSKDKSQFGHGDIRGVIGPDAANNASLGGSLVPTVAFGIPGSLGAAILLGALVLQGLRPGPEMLGANLNLTFSMVWSLIVANVVASVILLFWANQVAKAAFVNGHLVVPGVILFLFMGSWLGSGHLGDWITCIIFGVIGFVMKRGGWPRPPMVLALVLGAIMENALIISQRVHDGSGWITRPVVLIILMLILATVFFSARSMLRSRREDRQAAAAGIQTPPKAGEGRGGDPILGLFFGVLLVIVFTGAVAMSTQWSFAVGGFPMVIGIFGAAVSLVWLAREIVLQRRAVAVGARPSWAATVEGTLLLGASQFYGYILVMIVAAVLVGQKIALPVFIAVYLRRWGRFPWWVAGVGAAIGWLILVGFYDRLIRIFFMQPVFDEWMRGMLPAGFPVWLVL